MRYCYPDRYSCYYDNCFSGYMPQTRWQPNWQQQMWQLMWQQQMWQQQMWQQQMWQQQLWQQPGPQQPEPPHPCPPRPCPPQPCPPHPCPPQPCPPHPCPPRPCPPQPCPPPPCPRPTFSATYDANGGEGSYIDGNICPGSLYTVRTVEETGITRSGYIFTGWNSAPDGSGISYAPGNMLPVYCNTILYAQWTNTYTVTYHRNPPAGSDATFQDGPITVGVSYAILAFADTGLADVPGYSFVEWNTQPDGSGAGYTAGDIVTFNQNTQLYAIWLGD